MPSISLSTPLSLTPLLESQASTTTALLSHIQSNWSLASPSTILPETICPSDDPQYWPIDLIEALSELSDLTPNQPERAWSLIDTYLQARIREASYTGGNKGIYARLETGDVVRASESARKMRVGREMEEVSMEMGKRKYSIRDEIKDGDGEGQVKGKKQKTTPPPPALELDTNVPTIASLLSALSPSPSPSPTQISTMALKPRPQQSHNTPFRPILPRLVTIPPPPRSHLPSLHHNPNTHTQSSHQASASRLDTLWLAANKAARLADRRLQTLEDMQRKVAIVHKQWVELEYRSREARGRAEGEERRIRGW